MGQDGDQPLVSMPSAAPVLSRQKGPFMHRETPISVIGCLAVLSVFSVFLTPSNARAADFTIPESKLLDAEFASTQWGGSVTRSDAAGDAVRFSFTGLSDSGTGLKDDYPVDVVYGQNLPSHGNGDFSNFSGYTLHFENLDGQPVLLSLFINTGFTGPSGIPASDPTNDTFWQSAWVELLAGQSKVVTLDFDSAIPRNVEDNKSPHTLGGTKEVAMAINSYDRTELSAIGFEIRGPDNAEAEILVTPIPEPATLGMLIIGGGVGKLLKRRRR